MAWFRPRFPYVQKRHRVGLFSARLYNLRWLSRFPRHLMERGLIVAGGGAGVAAAFNTPLAGIAFAIEEMARSFEARASGTLITAVIIAGVAAVYVQGNYTYFGATSATLAGASGWLGVLLCGPPRSLGPRAGATHPQPDPCPAWSA